MAIIGIDLGTSNSAAAVLRGGRPVIIPSAEGVSLGGKAFPSYVAVTLDGHILVGEPARFAFRCQNTCHLLSAICMNACAPSPKPRGDEFP
jgi:molecular chaperone DnaK (HSP70)